MIASVAIALALALVVIAGAVLCENAVHISPRFRTTLPPAIAQTLADSETSTWSAVQITAADNVTLRARLFHPQLPNGDAALLLHGVSDTRSGVLGLARLMLRHHYTVLAPDSRGHGASGGLLATYGLKEVDDIGRWVDFLFTQASVRRVYGVGESMGAAILLQSLAAEHRFTAIVAECPFASFREVAVDRLAQWADTSPTGARLIFTAPIAAAFVYARLRYGLDLDQASPQRVIRDTRIPILLVHGLNDRNIPPRHSRILRHANPKTVCLWEVPGAGHTGAMTTEPVEFERRVMEFFAAAGSLQ